MHLLVSKSIAFLELLFIHLKYLFIWLHEVLVVACSIFIAACRIFPCDAQASLVVAWSLSRLVQGLSGCPIACGILVPCPGIVPMPPALEGRFLSTGLPGKSQESPDPGCLSNFPSPDSLMLFISVNSHLFAVFRVEPNLSLLFSIVYIHCNNPE